MGQHRGRPSQSKESPGTSTLTLHREAGVELTPAGATHPHGEDPEVRIGPLIALIAPHFPN